MMDNIFSLGLNTYREAIRQKVLYGLMFFMVLLILMAYFLAQLAVGDADVKIIKDMGLATIFFLGSVVSISMGISLVYKEIERKTIYTILSKPVSRTEFVIGKFIGLAVTLFVKVVLMTCLLLAVLSFYPEGADWNLWKASFLIFVELCVLVSIALVFSSYSSSFMSGLFCFSILMVGHLTDDLVSIVVKTIQRTKVSLPFPPEVFEWIKVFSFDHFIINSQIVYGVPVGMNRIFFGGLYGFFWVVFFLTIAVSLFRLKDLK
ncbi:MAG: ABC transporter permease subunit [Bdellovibrionales bacterium]|nr:ABC transporter permease subunit [Bdellovibrionales bacterium]